MQTRQETRYSLAQIQSCLRDSNAVEGVFGDKAADDALAAWVWLGGRDGLNQAAILGCHGVLMQGIDPRMAGIVRNVNVRVGGYSCPPWDRVPRLMDAWLMNHSKASDAEAIKRAHVAFEKIHPFEDGNGRTGRIIMNWQRVRAGLPLFHLRPGVEQQEYYRWFRS